MPVYNYKAINDKGESVRGVISAESVKIASDKLRKGGVYLSSIKEATGSRRSSISLPWTGVSTSELAVMTRQFSTLVSSGLPLETSLVALYEQTDDQKLKEILSQVRSRVSEGSSLHVALEEHKNVFSDLYVSMVRAGEASGTLDVVLGRLADFLEKQQELTSKIRGAMIYPAIMFIVGLGVLVFMMTFVIPKVADIFEASNKALPFVTVVLIGASDFLRENFALILVFMAAVFFFAHRYVKTPSGRKVYDRFSLRVPVFGKMSSKVMISRFTRTLSTLLSSGIPLLESVKVSESVLGNSLYVENIKDVRVKVAEGAAFGSSLGQTGIFPPLVVRMVSVGEEAGKIEDMLSKVADMYDTEVDGMLSTLTSLLEPVMILIMGVVMGFIVFAILLPVLNLTSVIN
ncbi:MAG: type II secretion system protein GspF [Candidatus Dadabacteria bacterium]|nr:type II secretion system protein GspF [Candidatus Dadabacteria bacterium]MYA48615.1 type II secretion system protein GspF [Candidatus Dadabacteria bacterium]MYF48494.1 type II secretion system protein GspF [Candidatus Dadabacteria bacterium]MYG82779.1 type II secretion system protein GspF [Candidatus Dadabacteria bacterium]MYK48757.1 type II secretion system protein GspF [Candidatus Dadabacteria bacterium]